MLFRSRAATGGLRVTAGSGEAAQEETFDVVAVALPIDHLKEIVFEGPRLAASLGGHVAHHDHPAHYVRITVLFDRPFWRSWLREGFMMLDAFGGCCLYDESCRDPGATHGALGWLLGGDAALAMSGWDDDELVAAALASLPDTMEPARCRALEGRVHRWIGAVNAIPGGRSRLSIDRRHQPEPVEHPCLFLVGDYLFDSTMNGVLDSAEYVAGWIADLAAARRGACA